jgi:purine-binding chemotaxis protein CheW
MQSILRVSPSDVDPVPPVLARGGAEARLQAICRLDGGTRLVSVLAAETLLNEDLTRRLLQSGSGGKDQMDVHKSSGSSEQFLIFRIGTEEFGLSISAVDEVVPVPPRLTPLPKAPDFVQGVMSVRGQVIPVIDQAQRFNGSAASGEKRRVVVVRIDGLHAGFIVDAVTQILRIDTDTLQDAPDLGREETRIFERVANLEQAGKLVLIVSPRELLNRVEQDMLQGIAKKADLVQP